MSSAILREHPVPGRYVHSDIELAAQPTHSIDYKKECKSLAVEVFDAYMHMPRVNGIFDTGAQSVCLRETLPARWGMTHIGNAEVSGANGTAKADVWRGDIKIDVGGVILLKNIVVWETKLPGSIDALIGQPVIKLFDFHVWAGFKGVTLSRADKNL